MPEDEQDRNTSNNDPAISAVLEAIADTFVAQLDQEECTKIETSYLSSIEKELQTDQTVRDAYYKFKASDTGNIGDKMQEFLVLVAPKDKLSGILFVLRLLNSTIGTWVVCGGGFKTLKSFPKLDREDREIAMSRLGNSWFADIRQLFKVFVGTTLILAYGYDLKDQLNVSWNAMKYDGPGSINQADIPLDTWEPEFIATSQMLKNSDGIAQLHCDVVVVGSGAGGSIMAAELSKAGHKVILTEKAQYTSTKNLSMTEYQSLIEKFDNFGALYSEDASIQMLAGSVWGGGTAVNWLACFKPPQKLRQEWKSKYGLDFFATTEFDDSVQAAWDRIGSTRDNVVHNTPNQLLLDGCKVAGFHHDTIDQNTAGQRHECGLCTFGCPYGIKQSSGITWLRDASDNGCKFVDGFKAEKVLHNRNQASGIMGSKNGEQIIIKSKYVVLSCGSIQTPCLLLKSKFERLNAHVGKHLRLHPVTLIAGVFANKNVMPSQGSIMTAVSNEICDIDTEGYGVKIEVPTAHPALASLGFKWNSSLDHKLKMLKFPNTTPLIVLTRDKDSEGVIRVDETGLPRISWNLGKFDSKSMLQGINTAIRILLAAGATEIYTGQYHLAESFFRNLKDDYKTVIDSPEFMSYIGRVNEIGIQQGHCTIMSAHQMGSCRMSSNAKQGAVDQHGRLFGVHNLYVSDGSVLPTASGVK